VHNSPGTSEYSEETRVQETESAPAVRAARPALLDYIGRVGYGRHSPNSFHSLQTKKPI